MEYTTKQVKKNFLKERLMGILVILILTLTMVPCFTSCSHGNNPEKSKPEVEDKNKKPDTPNPPKPTDPVPGKTSDQLIEELAAKKLGKINQDTYFHIFDVSDVNSDKFQKELKDNMNPFNLGRKKGDESKKLYLISSKFDPGHGITPTLGGLYESVADLKNKINKIFLNGWGSSTPAPYLPDEDSYGFNTLADALEWKWNIVKSESEGKHFFYEQCYPWLAFKTDPTLYQYSGSNLKNAYKVADSGTDYIIRGLNNGKPEIYFHNVANPNYFRWWVTFINSNDKSQIYSFHVGPYYIKMVAYDEKNNIIPPPADDAEYPDKKDDMKHNYNLPVVHMLKLSTMVRISLGKEPGELLNDLEKDIINVKLPKKLQYEAYKAVPSKTLSDEDAKKLAKEKVEDFIKINPFVNNFANLSNWDVYLTFGEFYLGFGSTATQAEFMWHNTVKLTGPDADAYWGKCWE